MKKKSVCLLCGLICAAALAAGACSGGGTVSRSTEEENTGAAVRTGLNAEQILEGEEGEIHYSYYLPDDYDESNTYPLVVVMPGYDMMWFGEESSGSNLNWNGFLAWTELDEDVIVVSAQLTDWGGKSARQAIELTEYFLENFSVNPDRVYAAGYSAGGETMSQAVSMRPDLYAAYLHGASRWDGEYAPIAENGVAVYIFMAESDEYYGSDRARDAYERLYAAYEAAGWTQQQIDGVLQVQIPDDAYFHERGIYGNYHGGGKIYRICEEKPADGIRGYITDRTGREKRREKRKLNIYA